MLKIRKVRFYWIGVEWEFQRAEPSRILEVEMHICVCIINIYVYGPLSVCFKYLQFFSNIVLLICLEEQLWKSQSNGDYYSLLFYFLKYLGTYEIHWKLHAS